MDGGTDHASSIGRESLVLKPVCARSDILPTYRDTPIADLLAMQNLKRLATPVVSPSMLIVTCMDARLLLRIPEQGAFVIRTAGAAPEPALSNIAFVVAGADVHTLCIIGHTDCAMARAQVARQPFLHHLTEQEGWSNERSVAMFEDLQQIFAIDDPVVATNKRARWLAAQFPTCLVAPLLYQVEDHTLVQIATADGTTT